VSQRLIIKSNVPIEAYGKDTHTETIEIKGWVKAIHITINTAITVSAGSVVANCSPKSFKVWHNGKLIVHIDGQSEVDNKESGGPSLLRFLFLMKNGLALTSDYWTIPFSPPLPPGEIIFQLVNQSSEHIGANASGTVTAGDYNIEVDYLIKGKKGGSIPIWKTGIWSDVANLGTCLHTLPKLPKPLRMIVFCTHDEGTRSATTYETLQIVYNGQTLYDSKLTKLTNEMQQKAGVATTAGYFFKAFPQGLVSNGSNIEFNFIAVSAGTKKYIEYMVICY